MALYVKRPKFLSYPDFIGNPFTYQIDLRFDSFVNWTTVLSFTGVHFGWSAETETMYFSEVGGTNYFGSKTIDPNKLYKFVWAWDGVTDNLYVDGELEISTTGMTSVSRESTEIAYLINSDTTNLTGISIDCIKAWNAVLSEEEIKQEIYSISPLRFRELWAWLPCNLGAMIGRDNSGNDRHFSQMRGDIEETAPNNTRWR